MPCAGRCETPWATRDHGLGSAREGQQADPAELPRRCGPGQPSDRGEAPGSDRQLRLIRRTMRGRFCGAGPLSLPIIIQ
jgi:hypothetical protein